MFNMRPNHNIQGLHGETTATEMFRGLTDCCRKEMFSLDPHLTSSLCCTEDFVCLSSTTADVPLS